MAESQQVLFVVTNHDQLGDTGEKTGYWLGEASHPYHALTEAGYTVDFVSPNGGATPVDPDSEDYDDPINEEFVESDAYTEQLQNTLIPDDIDPDDYAAILFVGGHGPIWDVTENDQLATLAAQIYEAGGVVSAVCHGPVGILNVQLSDGEYLIDGKRVAGFTNEEEEEVGYTDAVPFLLESELEERGADHRSAEPWAEQVETDGRLVTGQNPQSAQKLGDEVVEAIESTQ
jgi:putative intracellular protease/amidase